MQDLQIARAKTDFFLQFTIGALFGGFVAIEAPLGQAQFVASYPRAVLAHEQDGFIVQHWHDDDSTQAATLQTLIDAALAIGELKIELLDVQETAVVHVTGGMDDRRLAHRGILSLKRLT